MWHHFMVLFTMLLWMIGPIAIYAVSPRKRRDPYVWVFVATMCGPLVPLIYFLLPSKPQAA